ncbi:MAG: s-methyl-5-thioribose-1-phosphate isomerase, partial [Chitinispirillaceae bacterium]|nr:s-methyl-5-thioribose-1-phosphate isomerase [Chitinispirillaceae bacterium]
MATTNITRLKTIDWREEKLIIIDQTSLPEQLIYLHIKNVEELYDAIKKLKVRGAPAIGIAAAFGCYIAVKDFPDHGKISDLLVLLEKNCDYLAESRPTAVNLFWALNRVKEKVQKLAERNSTVRDIKKAILDEAKSILEEDRAMGRAIGEHGLTLLKDVDVILTHCNAGGLATAEYGTALAPVYVALEKGKIIKVYADETRPLLQGARITAFELKYASIPVTLICDNMAAYVMKKKGIKAKILSSELNKKACDYGRKNVLLNKLSDYIK